MGNRLWATGNSQWSTVYEQQSMVYGQQSTIYEQQSMSNSLWSIVYRQQTRVGGCEESQRGKEKREREPKGKARKGARQGGLSNTRVALVSFPFGDFI